MKKYFGRRDPITLVKKHCFLKSKNWYRTMSGGYRDSHAVRFVSKDAFKNSTSNELAALIK